MAHSMKLGLTIVKTRVKEERSGNRSGGSACMKGGAARQIWEANVTKS
jgi:hypothetical protein